MSRSLVDQIARAVLYEGYILYPYRPSVKSQQRWTFGGIYPRCYSEAQQGSDPYAMQSECLIRVDGDATVTLTICFLHLTARTVEEAQYTPGLDEPQYRPVQTIEVAGGLFQTWQEAVERRIDSGDVNMNDLLNHPRRQPFTFPHNHTVEILSQPDGRTAGRLVREQQQIDGTIEFSAERKSDGLFQLTARVINQTHLDNAQNASRDYAQLKSFASTHMILTTREGQFISPTDPPESLRTLTDECINAGCWPVLVGQPPATDTLLVSPIILSDYPQIAPESPGDLFDGCEIDEILTLRIMTLTDEEKRHAVAVDPLAADMMARTQALARDQLMSLHGVMRSPTAPQSPPSISTATHDQSMMSEAYYG